MNAADVFSTASYMFCKPERDEWDQVVHPAAWADFKASLKRMAGQDLAPALKTPPSFEEELSFFSHHLAGGMPGSAVPVESLYVQDELRAASCPRDSRPYYNQLSATYMTELVGRLGLTVPQKFAGLPDHLSLELDMLSLLLRSNMGDQARNFAASRFGWLPRYRDKLAQSASGTGFHLALLDMLVPAVHAVANICPA